jgi:hypothetical protein
MKILKAVREDNYVQFRQEVDGHNSTEEHDIKAHEAPLVSFDTHLQALAPVACKVLEFPPSYAEGATVKSVTVSHTKRGTRSVAIKIVKTLDATGNAHAITTPLFQIDDAAEGEEGRKQVSQAHADACGVFLLEVEKYASGERQQRLLPLDDTAAPVEPANGDVLDFKTKAEAPPPAKSTYGW